MNEDSTGTISVDEAADMVIRNSQEQSEPEDATNQTETEAEDTEEVEEEALEAETDDQSEDDDAEEEVEDADDEETGELYYEFDGETVSESQLREWRKNGMLHSDYTRKRQEDSEARKAFEAEQQATQQLKAQLQDALATFAIDNEPEPDWAKLNAELDPKEFNNLQLEWKQKKAQKQQAAEAYQLMQQQQQQEVLAREKAAILEHLPAWSDLAVVNAQLPKMAEYAQNFGFSGDEFAGIVDHRMYRVLDRLLTLETQAAEVNKATSAISKRVAKAKPKLPPGSKPAKNQSDSKERRFKRDRLKRENSIDAAVDYLLG